MKISNYPFMVSYCAIQSFDHTISLASYGHKNILSPNIYPYISRSNDDDSVDEPIKIFFTVHHCSSHRLLKSSSYETI